MSRLARWIMLLTFALVLSACSDGAPAASETPEEMAPVPTSTRTIEPTPEMTAETPVLVSGCETCHTDKQRLIDTADPEEEVASENEGAG